MNEWFHRNEESLAWLFVNLMTFIVIMVILISVHNGGLK